MQCYRTRGESETGQRHRAAEVIGVPAEIEHGSVEPRRRGQILTFPINVTVETQVSEFLGGLFEPPLAGAMRSAHRDIKPPEQAGAFRLQGMIHQSRGIGKGGAIEARDFQHRRRHNQRLLLDAAFVDPLVRDQRVRGVAIGRAAIRACGCLRHAPAHQA